MSIEENTENRFYTVGELRKLLDGLPDNKFIACQVIAMDGSVGNMRADFCREIPNGTIACISFSHPELKSLVFEQEIKNFETLVCNACGKVKQEGLNYCECLEGTDWIKK